MEQLINPTIVLACVTGDAGGSFDRLECLMVDLFSAATLQCDHFHKFLYHTFFSDIPHGARVSFIFVILW